MNLDQGMEKVISKKKGECYVKRRKHKIIKFISNQSRL